MSSDRRRSQDRITCVETPMIEAASPMLKLSRTGAPLLAIATLRLTRPSAGSRQAMLRTLDLPLDIVGVARVKVSSRNRARAGVVIPPAQDSVHDRPAGSRGCLYLSRHECFLGAGSRREGGPEQQAADAVHGRE